MTPTEALDQLMKAIDRETMGSDGGAFVKLGRIDRELFAARESLVEERCESRVG
jgi:hypothetical protein